MLLRSGAEAVDESQQFAVRWEEDPLPATTGRRASAPSLAQARLDAALEGQDDLREESPNWDGGAFSLRLGARRTTLLALSPALVSLQDKLLAGAGPGGGLGGGRPARRGARTRRVRRRCTGSLPPAFTERRRRLFERLESTQTPRRRRDPAWDEELRAGGVGVLPDLPAGPRLRGPTTRLRSASAGPRHRAAVRSTPSDTPRSPPMLVLPLHPLRLAWAAEHDATLTRWAGSSRTVGRSAVRSGSSRWTRGWSAGSRRRTCRSRCYGVDGLPFVYVREATLGTGVYLHADEAEPGAAVQAVFEVLGLDRRDVAADLPPSAVAERIAAYRAVNPGQEALRVLAYNAGSGELLARALGESVLREPERDEDVAAPPGPAGAHGLQQPTVLHRPRARLD